MYPGLTNTRVELRKIVRSSCFMILRIHFITTRKIQEIAFQGFQISKCSRGSMPPDPPIDGSRLWREIVPPPSMPWRRHCANLICDLQPKLSNRFKFFLATFYYTFSS